MEDVHTWHINASNKNSKMELVLYCKRDEMMLFNYEAPDGQKDTTVYGMVETVGVKSNYTKKMEP